MGLFWFAACLVVSASALALHLGSKDPSLSSTAPDVSTGQGGSKKELLSVNSLVVASTGASTFSERAKALTLEASVDQQPSQRSSLLLGPLLDQLLPLGEPGASGRVIPGPTPSAQAKPEVHRMPTSHPASSVAGSGPSGLTLLLPSALKSSQSSLSPSSSLPSLSPPPLPLLFLPSSLSLPTSLPSSSQAPPTPASSFSSHTSSPPLSPASLSLLPLSSLTPSLASTPSSSASPSRPSSLLSLSPSPSSPQSPFQSTPTSPSQVLAPIFPLTTIAGIFPDPSVSKVLPTITDSLINTSSPTPSSFKPSPMVTEAATPQWTVQLGPVSSPNPAPVTALSLGCTSTLPSTPPTSGSQWVPKSSIPGGAGPTQSAAPPDPGQVSLHNSASSVPRPSHVFHSVTFRITSEAFSAALWNPASLEHQLLSKKVRDELEPVYHKAFPSFEGIGILVFSSVAVNAPLVFGCCAPGPTARQVLWTLYCNVKAARQTLGNLSLAENSLASDGSTLTDLAQETVSIRFIAMRPFLSQFLVPGSALFAMMEEQTLQQVTPVVSGFYKMHPQEGLLLLFSNADQWVDVYIEYKFPAPVPTHLRGLANHLARKVLDPTLQKWSILANGEKAELVLYEVWLQILGRPFTTALRNKSSAESQELRGQLTRGLTTVLSHLQNLGQVVVEEFLPEPLTARVGATFFRAAPARTLVQDCVRQGLHTLWVAEGLSVEMVMPDFGTPSSGASGQPSTSLPSYAVVLIVLSLLVIIIAFVLVLKWRACCRVFSLGDRKAHSQSSTAQ